MQNRKMLSSLISIALLSLSATGMAYAADPVPAPSAAPHTGPNAPTTAGVYVDDSLITAKVKAALIEDKQVSGLKINVVTDQGVVKMSGVVPSFDASQRAIELAASVKGVKDVKSELQVKTAS